MTGKKELNEFKPRTIVVSFFKSTKYWIRKNLFCTVKKVKKKNFAKKNSEKKFLLHQSCSANQSLSKKEKKRFLKW